MKRVLWVLLLAVATVASVAACATLQNRWEAAKSADTITAYEDFLTECPEGDWADQARTRRNELYEERDWKAAEANNTMAGYEDFMNHYPQGRRKNDAYARREKLSAERFLRRYQQGVFMDDALFTLEKLSFEQAAAVDTISAYEDFLKRYPAGRLADHARRRVERLSFEQTHAEETILSNGGYVNRHPDGVIADASRFRQKKPKPIPPEAVWGKIMYPKRNTNIRANRSATSPRKGQLKNDQPVKADFLQEGWYAVFPITQKERNEKMALGYVYAPLLVDKPGPNASERAASEEPSKKDSLLKVMETEGPSVEVKNITFKVAGDGKELLFIEFDRFYTPAISGIEGKAPKIIMEIMNASPIREDLAVIHAGGHFIRRIRSSMDSQTRAARIVLDMAPEKDYFVNQALYIKENLYSLEISDKKGMPVP